MDVRTPPHDAAPDAERPVRTAVGDLDALPPGPPSEPRTPRWPTGPPYRLDAAGCSSASSR
ncbi:hypothetical protein [Streptomyces sp. NPDC003877]